jgi:hypothetical protein
MNLKQVINDWLAEKGYKVIVQDSPSSPYWYYYGRSIMFADVDIGSVAVFNGPFYNCSWDKIERLYIADPKFFEEAELRLKRGIEFLDRDMDRG